MSGGRCARQQQIPGHGAEEHARDPMRFLTTGTMGRARQLRSPMQCQTPSVERASAHAAGGGSVRLWREENGGRRSGHLFLHLHVGSGCHPTFSVSKVGQTQRDGGVPERAALPPRHSSATLLEISVMPSARSAHSRISWNLRVLLYEFLWSYFMESACLVVRISLVFRQRSLGE